jgi:hypothetical protein
MFSLFEVREKARKQDWTCRASSSTNCDRIRKNWVCDYTQSDPNSISKSFLWPSVSLIKEDRPNVQSIDFPILLFLDSRVLQYSRKEGSGSSIPTPGHINDLIGDVTEIRIFASHFFNTVQSWMPIISKKRFYDHYLSPLSPSQPDLALLFLCMKLISEVLPENAKNPQTSIYLTAKQFYLVVETAGILSIQVLQAGVLISLYELGHAIYPSAFLSIGACARYAYVLGINGNASSQISKPLTWVEQEERRRVWWAIVILDRFEKPFCFIPAVSLVLRSGYTLEVALSCHVTILTAVMS